ncbi:ATP-binding protein [Klebsiella quasipneumoniae]|uniref:ATP-binding protein n=1 Tax=Klebsiella quasipneumoniae TaxID=1463165 RepID=UPI003369FD08
MLVKKANLDGVDIAIALEKEHPGNYFSVIVGKNGVGKSRLLRNISQGVYDPSVHKKTICISNGYFHKFISNGDWIRYERMYDHGYRNLCLSDSIGGHSTRGDNFSNVFNRELISLFFGSGESRDKALHALHEFGFCDGVNIEFSLYKYLGLFDGNVMRFDKNALNVNVEMSKWYNRMTEEELECIYNNAVKFMSATNYLEVMKKQCPEWGRVGFNEEHTIEFCFKNHGLKLSYNFGFGTEDSAENNFTDEFKESLLFLNKYRLISVHKTIFKKNDQDINMEELSSGELSILFSILKINSEIEDGSLILIDEPELSLHPAWQSQIIPSLEKCFSSYTGCHFVIATHSPLVVSSIPESNSAIVILDEDAKIISGSKSHRKSADYQLFTVLGYAGDQNEYVKRRLMIIISKLSTGVDLNSNELLFIEKAQNLLEDADDEDLTKYLLNQAICLLREV